MNEGELTMSVESACRALGISKSTGYQLCRCNRFPGNASLRIGKRYVISRHLMAKWLAGETQEKVDQNG
jgi:excisionase family DNA binding protein